MVLDTAKLKNRKSTTKPGMRGRDAAKELTLKVDISQVFTIDFSEIQFIVNHNSQLVGPNKSAKRWTNWQKHNHTYHLSEEEFKRYQGQWYLTLNNQAKNAPMRLRPDFRAAVPLKKGLHREYGEEFAEPISPAHFWR